MSDVIKVFVGTSPAGQDAEACAVLEYTLRKHASREVEIEWLALSRDLGAPGGGWVTERWSSPWTGLRWAVPALCAFRGRAIYLDCPQIMLGDIAELADAEMPSKAVALMTRVGRTLRTGCMVWDCARAKKFVPDLPTLRADLGSHQVMSTGLVEKPHLVADLPRGWGLHDVEYSAAPAAATGSVHCANLYMQPHARHALSRLRREGRDHWFKAVRMRHFCTGLVDLFDREYEASQAESFWLEKYNFGELVPWGREEERA